MRPLVLCLFSAIFCIACTEYNLEKETDPPEEPVADDIEIDSAPPPVVDTGEPPAVDTGPILEPDIEVDPMTIDFGGLPANCEADPQTIAITNVGNDTLKIFSIALQGVDIDVFSQDGGPINLAPNTSTTVELGFFPTEFVTYDVDLHITSDDPDEGELDVEVLGEGSLAGTMTESWTQGDPSAVDVLWIIDNSGSMADSLNSLQQSFFTFIQLLITLNIDYQIGVVTTDMVNTDHQGQLAGPIITASTPNPIATFGSAISQGSGGSDVEQGLDAAYSALSEPLISTTNVGLVRDDTLLSLIVVSDEDDQSVLPEAQPGAFSTWLNNYQGDPTLTSFSSVAGPCTGSPMTVFGMTIPFSGIVEAAPTYAQVVNSTGGMHQSICAQDFEQIVTYLAYVSSGLQFVFPLSQVPVDPSGMTVTVGGNVIPYGEPDGWTYDPATNKVTLHGASLPLPGQETKITYPIPGTCPE